MTISRSPSSRCSWLISGVVHLALALASVVISRPALALPSSVRVEPNAGELRVRISVGREGVAFAPTKGGETVTLQGEGTTSVSPGSPALPVIRLVLRVDDDFRAESVRVVSVKDESLGSHRLASGDGEAGGFGAAPAEIVPGQPAIIEGEGWLRGRRLVYLAVYPLRVRPVTGEVLLARELELELGGRADAAEGLRPRPVPWESRVEESLQSLVVDLRRNRVGRDVPPQAEELQVWSPTFRPTLDGSPVEYVIITSEAMRTTFETLATWKTAKGVQTVVRTVEWIAAAYPSGVDRAEQIRFFISDAYENWGTLWVLLGGDTDIVPVRYGYHTGVNPPIAIPTDLYFACLDGNWNGDGDPFFGEGRPAGQPSGGDNADLQPDVFLGRAPVSTAAHATVFVNKVINYEKALAVTSLYPASALLLGEELSPSIDGATLCEEVRQRLPPGIRVVRMYENYQNYSPPPVILPEHRPAVIDSLNSGFGIVHHVGHGYRNTMSVGDGTISNSDADNLLNGNRLSVVYAINCASGAMDFNSISERLIKNPNGGAVAYIGSSRITIPGEAYLNLQNEFYEIAFQDSVTSAGQALALSKVPFVGDAIYESETRWVMFAENLFGDPEMPIWRRAPNTIAVNNSISFVLGSPTYNLTATVNGIPLAGARVALVKPNNPPTSLDAYAVDSTLGNGSANVVFNPQTTGSFTVNVNKPDYKPFHGSATIQSPSEPFVYISQVTVNDDNTPPSSGNNDGFPDAGEVVELTVRLQNSGGAPVTNVVGTLSVLSGGQYLTIQQGSVTYGTLGVGGQSNGVSNYVISLNPAAPEAYQPLFQLSITSSLRNWTDTFVLPVRGVEIEHYSHDLTDPVPGGNGNGVPEPGEAIVYRVKARNDGTGRADQVNATLRVLRRSTGQPDPLVVVTDGSASFGTMLPGVVVTGDQMAFNIGAGAVISDLLVELTWTDSHGPRGVGLSDLIIPMGVDELTAVGSSSSIRLEWINSPAADLRGYDILRSTTPQGPYTRVNNHTIIRSAVYEDAGLPPFSRYYYQVVARDSSFNSSVPSSYTSATTTPPLAPGWPIETNQESSSGVVIDDLDGDHQLELVVGSNAIYAWHHDGTEVRDGDGNPSTSGVFATDGEDAAFGFQATPAIADLTGDGDIEIIGVAWRQAKVYVWNSNGQLEPGWPQTIGGDFNWASPAVQDLDGDGTKEIVVASGLEGKIFAWHYDGTEVVDGDNNPSTNGVFFQTGSSFLYSSPAVGDIDGDSVPEIVFGTQGLGLVYALSNTGALKPGWPDTTGGAVTASPAMADLDGDNRMEVIVPSEVDSVYVYRGNGSQYPGWPRGAFVNSSFAHTSSPVVADLDNDGNLDIIFAGNNGRMYAWKRDGTPLPGWGSVLFAQTALGDDATQATPTVANVDGDPNLEVILGAEDGLIYGWNHDGTQLDGFPLGSGGEVRGAATIWDLDNDGLVELCAITNDRNVYVWDLSGDFRFNRLPWPFFRHDSRNTGRFGSEYMSIGVSEPGPAPIVQAPALYPAFPNPFNPSTTIRFRVHGEAGAARPVDLAIYDIQGRLVRRLVHGPVETGEQAVVWDGRTERGGVAASGAYFVRYQVDGKALTHKLVMLK